MTRTAGVRIFAFVFMFVLAFVFTFAIAFTMVLRRSFFLHVWVLCMYIDVYATTSAGVVPKPLESNGMVVKEVCMLVVLLVLLLSFVVHTTCTCGWNQTAIGTLPYARNSRAHSYESDIEFFACLLNRGLGQ